MSHVAVVVVVVMVVVQRKKLTLTALIASNVRLISATVKLHAGCP